MKRLGILLVALLVGFGIYMSYLDFFTEHSMAIELSDKIEEFKNRKGHYPNSIRSVDLIDSLELNGNEWYPEYFSYQLDKTGLYYTILIYDDKIVTEVYDSRTKKVIRALE